MQIARRRFDGKGGHKGRKQGPPWGPSIHHSSPVSLVVKPLLHCEGRGGGGAARRAASGRRGAGGDAPHPPAPCTDKQQSLGGGFTVLERIVAEELACVMAVSS